MNKHKDICARKHKGNSESNAAHESIKECKSVWHLRIMRYIRKCKKGATCREVCHSYCKGMNEISGRFSELKQAGHIVKIGKRNGCAVYTCSGKTEL